MGIVEVIIITVEFVALLMGIGFVANLIPYKGDVTGKLTSIRYCSFPFKHTKFIFETLSPAYSYITVEGDHVLNAKIGKTYAITYHHIPIHYYNTLNEIMEETA